MSSPLFSGVATALVTPFCPSGIHYDAIHSMIQQQLLGGVSAIVVCGTTGESAALTKEEKEAIIRFTVAECTGKMKVIAGIGGNNTYTASEAAIAASDAGVDAVMLTAPYYNKTNTPGLIDHFTYVADRSAVPLIVYNVPGRTVMRCTDDVYFHLSKHPNICGIKEASGDLSLVSRTIARCVDSLTIWSGNDDQTFPMMALGAKGVISVASNLIPRSMTELCKACLNGQMDVARKMHLHFMPLFDALFSDVNPIPVKTALQQTGIPVGVLRRPLHPMAPEEREKLHQCLVQFKLID